MTEGMNYNTPQITMPPREPFYESNNMQEPLITNFEDPQRNNLPTQQQVYNQPPQTHNQQAGYTMPPQGGHTMPPQGGYAMPTQGGYAMPTQGGHTMPPQGGYPMPLQGGYAMPTQGGYSVPGHLNPTMVAPGYNVPYNPPMYPPPQPNITIVTEQNTGTTKAEPPVQPPTPTVIVINPSGGDGYPRLDKTMALVVLILNIFLPGVGTIIMGCVGNNAGGWICIGICQALLAFLIIGWIWSIITGLMCLKYST
jgi:hypothetical protein